MLTATVSRIPLAKMLVALADGRSDDVCRLHTKVRTLGWQAAKAWLREQQEHFVVPNRFD